MPGYKCPPVPPPAIKIRTDHAAPVSICACCEMFNSTPTPSRLISIEEPPLLTSGSGMPLVGISPSTTLTFTNACSTSIIVMPSARNAPKLSGARSEVRRPRQAITQKRSEEHTSELQSQSNLVCRLLLEKKKKKQYNRTE